MGWDFRTERGYSRDDFMSFLIIAMPDPGVCCMPQLWWVRAFSGVSSHLFTSFSFSITLNLIRCRLMRNQTGNESKRFRSYWATDPWRNEVSRKELCLICARLNPSSPFPWKRERQRQRAETEIDRFRNPWEVPLCKYHHLTSSCF